ncbi:D-alanyl-D-alanine carboxypeptidase family protein [Leucobacter sp. GX0328]
MSSPATDARLRRRRRARRLATTLLVTAIVVAGAGYAVAAARAPIPAPEVAPAADIAQPVIADAAAAQAAVDAQALPTAIGFAESDAVWANDDTAYPLGSITKLITILVCMDAKPLEPGAEGDTYVWTEEDAARTDSYLAVDGVAYSIPVGTELTQRDMLKFIFLPSANDYAHAYALWTFGTNEAYLEALAAWTAEHGLESISLIEPTGMEAEDVASAADLVRVARLALANPTIAEFNGMKYADMPWGVGIIENSNPLLGVVPGVIGTKTGTLNSFGRNLIVSQQVDALGRPITNISVTLGRQSNEERAASGAEMLEAMAPLPQEVPLLAEGTTVGEATLIDGSTVPLITAGSASAVMLPGEEATFEVVLGVAQTASEAGSEIGTVRVATPTGVQEVPVVTGGAISEPDFWWRLTHPRIVFG